MISLHFSAYQAAEYLDKFLSPWLQYKEKYGDLKISAGHVCFKEFQEMGFSVESPDGTHNLLKEKHKKGEIDYYSFIDKPLTEAEARTEILQPLLKDNVEFVWISAPDEIISLIEIEKAIEYTKKDKFIQWYRVEYKNLTFSETTYTRGFCPPRIYFNNRGYKIDRFFADDEILYKRNGQDINYLDLPSKQIPFQICSPLHHTWVNGQRSIQKVKYQEKRFNPPNGHGCSFKINKDKLEWNPDYYKRINQSFPDIYTI